MPSRLRSFLSCATAALLACGERERLVEQVAVDEKHRQWDSAEAAGPAQPDDGTAPAAPAFVGSSRADRGIGVVGSRGLRGSATKLDAMVIVSGERRELRVCGKPGRWLILAPTPNVLAALSQEYRFRATRPGQEVRMTLRLATAADTAAVGANGFARVDEVTPAATVTRCS